MIKNAVITVIYPKEDMIDQIFWCGRETHLEYFSDFSLKFNYQDIDKNNDPSFLLVNSGCVLIILDNIEERCIRRQCYRLLIPIPFTKWQEMKIFLILEELENVGEVIGEFYNIETKRVLPVNGIDQIKECLREQNNQKTKKI